jgi:hypothetical protein
MVSAIAFDHVGVELGFTLSMAKIEGDRTPLATS